MTAYAQREPQDFLSHDFSLVSVNPVEQINMWNSNVDPAGFDYNPNTYNYGGLAQEYPMDALDNTSMYDCNSSYAQSSAAPSEYDYSHHRTSKHGHGAYSQAPKASRRESTRSVAQSQGYADSGFYSSAISPAVEVDPYFSYAQNGHHEFSADFSQYESPPADSMFDFTVPDNQSSVGQTAPDSPNAASDGENTGYSSEGSTPARNHPLYNAAPADDGLYYCPFGEEGCGHEPKQLKCEYDKYIDSHLKPFRCRHSKCSDLQFSSTACLLRHEREAHEMHGHEESLCEYPPCNRSIPGNGFRRSYNCKDHMSRCHGWVDHNPQEGKKRRSATTGAGGSKVSKTKSSAKVPSKRQQVAQLKDEWAKRKANLEDLTRGLAPDGPLFAIALTQINNEMQTLKSIQIEWSKLTGRTHIE